MKGDLFLSSNWTPCLTAACASPYSTDDYDNGTIWTYRFSLDNHWGVEDETHNGILYSLNSADIDPNNPSDNNANAYLSDDFLSTSEFYYRNGQEVAVNTSSNVSKVGTGA